jgi:tetratricopeptide (TPR) repeat protein
MTKEDLLDDGNLALATGELEEAVKQYRAAVVLDPNYFDGWQALLMALFKLERYDEAVEAGLKAAELEPNDPLVWTGLSQAYVKNLQVPEAEAAAAKAKIISWGGKIKL